MPAEEPVDEYAKHAHNLVDDVIDSAIEKLKHETVAHEVVSGAIAGAVVSGVIDNAAEKLRQERRNKEWDLQSVESGIVHEPPKYEDFEVKNITWLTIEEFSVEKAQERINEFIKTWDYENSWQYCVDYLGQDEFEFDVRHRYRVRWSIPTRRKPIPRATASVYFTFNVSKIKPHNFPVDVFYVFETNRLVHKPGHSRFREKWLKDIIESKVILIDQISF